MTKRRFAEKPRRYWTVAEDRLLQTRYPDSPTSVLAGELGRTQEAVYARASSLGVTKSQAYLASPAACRLRRGDNVGMESRFKPGDVPANKGLRRPGWHRGRMRETQFRAGHFPFNRDPEFYVIGALRVNADGYIDMRVSFEPGARGWKALHRILWEDAHGLVPAGYAVSFKNRDRLDVELDNLELVSRVELARRNRMHGRLPERLVKTIVALGALKRAIRRKEAK